MKHKETILFAIIIALANIPLLAGGFAEQLIYLPDKVFVGQWWRLITHPFVHVSGYHLLMDASAFLMLYAQLKEGRFLRRMIYLLGIHTGITAAVTLSLASTQATGYCGLSGLAHGLMALWCIERIGTSNPDKTERRIAAGIGIGLLAKSLFEVAAGHVFFGFLHFGSVGQPIVISHLAGVLSAAAMYAVLNASNIKNRWTLKTKTLQVNA